MHALQYGMNESLTFVHTILLPASSTSYHTFLDLVQGERDEKSHHPYQGTEEHSRVSHVSVSSNFFSIFESADLEHTYVGGACPGREFMLASFPGMGSRPRITLHIFSS